MINFVDEKYCNGELDGYQYDDMPDDRDAWRLVARGSTSRPPQRCGAASFADADHEPSWRSSTASPKGDLQRRGLGRSSTSSGPSAS